VLNDAGCYPICASRIIFGEEPEEVFCDLVSDKETNVDIKATLFLKYKGMKFAQMSVGYDLFYQSTYSIWGTGGSLRLTRSYNIPPDMQATLILDSDAGKRDIMIEPVNHFVLMVDSFCRPIITGSASIFDFEDDLLKQARVMQAARLSNIEHRSVRIEEI
jgi:predicted dehydrogenase